MKLLSAGAIGAMLCTLVLPVPARAEPADERRFAERILPKMREAIPSGSLRIKPGEPLAIEWNRGAGWDHATFFLYRIYDYCLNATAKDCEAATDDYVRGMSAPPGKETAQALRVIVRGEEYAATLRAFNWPDGNRPLVRPIGEGLYAIVAFDSPETTSIATQKRTEALGLNDESTWDIAIRQTRKNLPKLDVDKLGAGEFIAYADIDYLASLLIETDDWAKISARAGPNLFVTAASDNLVLVGSISPGSDLEKLQQSVEEDCKAAPRCVSPHVYRFLDGHWVVAR